MVHPLVIPRLATTPSTSSAWLLAVLIGGNNKISGVGIVDAGTIVAGAGADTFTFADDYAGRLGAGAGNDSLQFAATVTGTSTVINAGAGNDTLQFTSTVSSASIVGGAGNDSLSFTSVEYTNAIVNEGSNYFYGSSGGTDTLFYTGNTTNTATFLTLMF